jgi:hypothetical protein
VRVICPHCGGKAIICNHKKVGNDFELHCVCTNLPECGAGVVYKLCFEHYIKEPRRAKEACNQQNLREVNSNEI